MIERFSAVLRVRGEEPGPVLILLLEAVAVYRVQLLQPMAIATGRHTQPGNRHGQIPYLRHGARIAILGGSSLAPNWPCAGYLGISGHSVLV